MTSKETDAMWRTRSEQPEALRLADALVNAIKQTDTEDNVILVARWFVEDAAAELRRLHAVNTELLGALKDLEAGYERLKDVGYPVSDCQKKARAVIAKATGEQA